MGGESSMEPLDTGLGVIELLTENPSICAIVVDQKGTVVSVNSTYLRVLQKSKEEVVGKYIGDVTPNTRTLVVLRTGKGVVGYDWSINGYNMIACALPLISNQTVVGCFAFSLFMDIWDAKDLVENLMFELNSYRNEVRNLYSAHYTFASIIGSSPKMQNVKFLAQQAALHSSTTVLITGESGTGKELFAHAIHNCSQRSRLPFVRVNCAAIPESLLEAELFGYVEGAYTGARKGGNLGKFELANGGTVFLDEIGEMPLSMQSKLLVVLQEKEFEKLGGSRPVRVNVRVIAATNCDLEAKVKQNGFREDLYYRLNVLRLEIPPLRERREDIPELVYHFIDKLNARLKTKVNEISTRAMQMLSNYHWPGNVRELENTLERAMILADMQGGNILEPSHLPLPHDNRNGTFPNGNAFQDGDAHRTLKTALEEFEKEYIANTLKNTGYDKEKAAKALGIDVSWLYKKLKKHNITARAN